MITHERTYLREMINTKNETREITSADVFKNVESHVNIDANKRTCVGRQKTSLILRFINKQKKEEKKVTYYV